MNTATLKSPAQIEAERHEARQLADWIIEKSRVVPRKVLNSAYVQDARAWKKAMVNALKVANAKTLDVHKLRTVVHEVEGYYKEGK
jgi:hypothetical protein